MACLKHSLIFLPLLLFLLPALPALAAPASGLSYSVPVSVTVNPAYALDLEIDVLGKSVPVGGDLEVFLELWKTGREGGILVGLDYEITKANKPPVTGSLDPVPVDDYTKETIKIPIPEDMRPGRYTLRITASHPQAVPDSAEDRPLIRPSNRMLRMIFEFLGAFLPSR